MVLGVAGAGYLHRYRVNGRLNWPSILGEPLLVPMLVVLAVVWLLPHNPYPNRFKTALKDHVLSRYKQLPSVHFDASPSQTFLSRYPANKTALYIEPRADVAFMVPLLLHMMMVVPPDWRFVFFGSKATVDIVRGSYTASMHEGLGKLHIRDLSESWGLDWGRNGWEEEGRISTDEITSRLLTNSTFYERELAGTEWLMVFHSDAILCANAEDSVDEWLGWDWVGAPWNNGARYGGNGGLSIRRISRVLEVLHFQKRLDDSLPEDQWMSGRLDTMPGAKMVPPEKAREFAVADVWHEWPLGFHVNPGGLSDGVWRPLERRQKIYQYCPEVKIILDMALDREKCPEQQEAERRESLQWQQDEEVKQGEEQKKLEEEAAKLEAERQEKEREKEAAAAAKKQEKEAALESARAKQNAAASARKYKGSASVPGGNSPKGRPLDGVKPPATSLPHGLSPNNIKGDASSANPNQQDKKDGEDEKGSGAVDKDSGGNEKDSGKDEKDRGENEEDSEEYGTDNGQHGKDSGEDEEDSREDVKNSGDDGAGSEKSGKIARPNDFAHNQGGRVEQDDESNNDEGNADVEADSEPGEQEGDGDGEDDGEGVLDKYPGAE